MKNIIFILGFFFVTLPSYGQIDCEIYGPGYDTVDFYDSITFCYGTEIVLFTYFYDTLNYYWEPNGETTPYIYAEVIEPTTYYLTIYNDDSSFTCTDSIFINVLPYPQIELISSPGNAIINELITFSFNNLSIDSIPLVRWEWYINGATYINELTPTCIFDQLGEYGIAFLWWTTDSCFGKEDIIIAVTPAGIKDLKLAGFQISPNPINDIMSVSYRLNKLSNITIVLYNINGIEIATLLKKKEIPGKHNITFDVSNLVQGIYLCEIIVDDRSKIFKLIVV